MKLLNLQLFAEEMAADTGIATQSEGTAEVESTPTDANASQPEVDTKPSFDELIKGDYKDEYKASVKKAIDKRFKNQADLQGKLDSLSPMLSIVASKYGISADENGNYDVEAVTKALEDDNSLYEKEAFEAGMDVDTYKRMKQMERENERYRAREEAARQEYEHRQGFEKLLSQVEDAKQFYPDYDLETELQNPMFGRMIGNGIDAKTAYEVLHKDEILSSGMQYAVARTKENVSKSIQSGLNRASENGLNNTSVANVGSMDPRTMDIKQLADIKRRAERGERITFV